MVIGVVEWSSPLQFSSSPTHNLVPVSSYVLLMIMTVIRETVITRRIDIILVAEGGAGTWRSLGSIVGWRGWWSCPSRSVNILRYIDGSWWALSTSTSQLPPINQSINQSSNRMNSNLSFLTATLEFEVCQNHLIHCFRRNGLFGSALYPSTTP